MPRRHHRVASACRGRAHRQTATSCATPVRSTAHTSTRADRRRGRVAPRRRVAGRQVPSRLLRAVRRLRHESCTERPYLSIGEVLGLLLEEFPDVTISKIRFLESQGLIDPERTASRLSQVLRQRRRSAAGDPARAARELPAATRHSRPLESGAIEDPTGPTTPPRGIRNGHQSRVRTTSTRTALAVLSPPTRRHRRNGTPSSPATWTAVPAASSRRGPPRGSPSRTATAARLPIRPHRVTATTVSRPPTCANSPD